MTARSTFDQLDADSLRTGDTWTGYLVGGKVTNWPGTLALEPARIRRSTAYGRHPRFDVWFTFEGRVWHGYAIGTKPLLRCQHLAQRTARLAVAA